MIFLEVLLGVKTNIPQRMKILLLDGYVVGLKTTHGYKGKVNLYV